MQMIALCTSSDVFWLQDERREGGGGGDGVRGKHIKKLTKEVRSGMSVMKRGRGRPRLTEEEKQRRKELRDLGLMKRSHRRTKEGQCASVGE